MRSFAALSVAVLVGAGCGGHDSGQPSTSPATATTPSTQNVTTTTSGPQVVFHLDGHGSLWPTSLDEWEIHACLVAGGNLTSEEWHRLIPQKPYAAICPQLPRP